MSTLTVYIAAPGAPISGESASTVGHMWYSLESGSGTISSFLVVQSLDEAQGNLVFGLAVDSDAIDGSGNTSNLNGSNEGVWTSDGTVTAVADITGSGVANSEFRVESNGSISLPVWKSRRRSRRVNSRCGSTA